MIFPGRQNDSRPDNNRIENRFSTHIALFRPDGILIVSIQTERKEVPELRSSYPHFQSIMLVIPVTDVGIGRIIRHSPIRIDDRRIKIRLFHLVPRIIETSPSKEILYLSSSFGVENHIIPTFSLLRTTKISVIKPIFQVCAGITE